jgi:DNA modification methylase
VSNAKILIGNANVRLKELPDQSVRTVITSPPYYGLRDYGTGDWQGGDPDCTHQRDNKRGKSTETGHANELLTVGDAIYKTVCPRCGAVREDEQMGLEETPEEFVEALVVLFREIRRVLTDDGTVWLNIGDSYAGSGKGRNGDGTVNVDPESKQATSQGTLEGTLVKSGVDLPAKNMIGIPWRLAFALQDDGWILRQDIIWAKPNPMPESVSDRCTKSHEYIFLLSKSPRYYFDNEAIKEPAQDWGTRDRTNGKYHNEGTGLTPHSGLTKSYETRNKRDVWTVSTKPYKGAHFATYPEDLITPCVLAGSAEGDTVLDPFTGSGTTAVVALRYGRNFVGTELNPEYAKLAESRITSDAPLFNTVELG